MFQDTCRSLSSAVLPIVIATRQHRGKLEFGVGAGMFINADGWFVTAGHVLHQLPKLEQQARASQSKQRPRGTDITHYVIMFGQKRGSAITAHVHTHIDLGIARMDGVVPPSNHVFPRFRKNRDVEAGELLCRIGFPFVGNHRPKWTARKGFEFPTMFPVPMFVNEALVSRFINVRSGNKDLGTWIETSSPGLMGQSGGPLADPHGYVCGIQVNTEHYPFGFKGKKVRNQFLHAGRAITAQTVTKVLDKYGIEYFTEET